MWLKLIKKKKRINKKFTSLERKNPLLKKVILQNFKHFYWACNFTLYRVQGISKSEACLQKVKLKYTSREEF